MSRLEALKSYTINAAYAAFEEESKGTLKVGKYADVVVLSKDILDVPEAEIPATQVQVHHRRRKGEVQAVAGPRRV